VKSLKPLVIKRSGKQEREKKVLLGLVEYYLRTGKPVGSNTLKEAGFDDLSSATIRNYFAALEDEGYLQQQHSSGGRIPTQKAYRLYANEYWDQPLPRPENEKEYQELRGYDSREIASYLQLATERLSSLTQCAAFLSAPRFDQDYISAIKLVAIDNSRIIAILITDFGLVKTEILQTEKKLSTHSIKRMESYFNWRLTGLDKPENMNKEEEQMAQKFYNELMVRYLVNYSNFTDDDIYRTGFSKLLSYTDFLDPTTLGNSLALFENAHSMRLLLRECRKHNGLKVWIGEDLQTFTMHSPECAVLASAYHINQQSAGAIGILGPIRIPYRELFGILQEFSGIISETLTRSLYKFKISFRQPQEPPLPLKKDEPHLIGQTRTMLLEDKRI
jgi:heat-inducible transcriptional repressor